MAPSTQQAKSTILHAFRTGQVPQALAQRYLRPYDYPAKGYSFGNQLILSIAGDPDARGYRAWQSAGRHVRRKQRARYILAPRQGRTTIAINGATGREERVRPVIGWRSLPVFGYDQTEGDPIPEREAIRSHLDSLPLLELAKDWGIGVTDTNARSSGALGWYAPGQIALGVENLSTWAHELVHAADDRRGALRQGSSDDAEVVAELGGAILLTTLGYQQEADLGGCHAYLSRHTDGPLLPTLERLLERTTSAVSLILDAAPQGGRG